MRRIHFLIALALGALGAAPVAAASDTEGAGNYDEYDEYDEGGDEFCGGEESSYDDAYFSFDEGDYEGARDILVTSLREENLYGSRWQYLLLLAQTQLRLNEVRHATVNFHRASAADPSAWEGAQIGLAVALVENGQRRRAESRATTYADEHCTAGDDTTVLCYVAFVVAATSSHDDESRQKNQAAARRVRSELNAYQRQALAYYDASFDVSAWPSPPADVVGQGAVAER